MSSEVRDLIVEIILPQVYEALNALLDHAQDAPKDVILQARKMLPQKYANSIANRTQEKVK